MFDLHPGAVYSNQGREYIVQDVNSSTQQIRLKQVHGQKYYTKCVDHKHATVLSRTHAFSSSAQLMEDQVEEKTLASTSQALTAIHAALTSSNPHPSAGSFSVLPAAPSQLWYIKPEKPLTWLELCAYGRVKIDTSVYAYRKISKLTCKVIDRVPLTLPKHEFETWACWVDVPPSIQEAYAKWALEQSTGVQASTLADEQKEHPEGGRSRKRVKTEASTPAAAAAASSTASPSEWNAADPDRLNDRPIHAGLHGLNHCMIALMPMSVEHTHALTHVRCIGGSCDLLRADTSFVDCCRLCTGIYCATVPTIFVATVHPCTRRVTSIAPHALIVC
jgi:hypothetical protein